MRSMKIDYSYNGKPTISKEEFFLLKESIKDTFQPDKISVLNKGLTKQKSFDILFNDKLNIKSHLEYMHFFNIVREFIVQKKTFGNWKRIQNYKPIKEIKEIRKEKINRIEGN